MQLASILFIQSHHSISASISQWI